MPLTMIKAGERASVIRFNGEGAEFARIRSFGIDINSDISVVTSQADIGGPVMVAVKDSRYAVDYNLALRILVLPIEESKNH